MKLVYGGLNQRNARVASRLKPTNISTRFLAHLMVRLTELIMIDEEEFLRLWDLLLALLFPV